MDSQTVISHENNLWILFRILAEEEIVPQSISDKIKHNIGEDDNEP